VQSLAPDWVRARVLALFMLITQGGMAGGSAVWGMVGSRASVTTALVWAGLGTMATTALAFVARLPDTTADVSPWVHWRAPVIVQNSAPEMEQGPVLVTVEYGVERHKAKEFLRAMHRYGRVRRRDGAFRWAVYRDLERDDVYLETFLVSSWAEHLRQHERITRADRELEDRTRALSRAEPKVRHLVYAESED
jgi:hypothetical protein